MKIKRVLINVIVILAILFVILGIPFLIYYKNIFKDKSVVADSTIILPDVPNGSYVVLMKKSLHKDTLDKWEAFFTNDEENIEVIFEDLSCLVSNGDTLAIELAKRYQAVLPANQFQINSIDSTLLASKVENGYLDVAIFSKGYADFLKLKNEENMIDVKIINVEGEN